MEESCLGHQTEALPRRTWTEKTEINLKDEYYDIACLSTCYYACFMLLTCIVQRLGVWVHVLWMSHRPSHSIYIFINCLCLTHTSHGCWFWSAVGWSWCMRLQSHDRMIGVTFRKQSHFSTNVTQYMNNVGLLC